MSELDAAPRFSATKSLLIAGFLSWGCSELLGLEQPHPRPTTQSGGASGQATGGSSGTEAGEGGKAGGSSDGCNVGNRRCAGETSTTPEVCDDERNWVVNDSENGGADCPVYCDAGACTECRGAERTCHGKEPQHCEDGAWQEETTCQHYCRNGACENPPSCDSPSTEACGSEGATCCSALEVPGGSFIRDYDNVDPFTDMSYQATLSSFLLDEFEVTVGRFRNFVEGYSGVQLDPGDGKAAHIPADDGWQTTYPLPTTAQELREQLACTRSTWTDAMGSDEDRPVNCVDFFVAYAFCIWDGGRLPTEAEWNRAAAGGDEQRLYPWSVPAGSTLLTPDHAAYGSTDPLPLAVGSKPLGNGRWNHADLAGNLFEWTLDLYRNPYESTQCNDCLSVTGMIENEIGFRSIRGGSFVHGQALLRVSSRQNYKEDEHQFYMGFRCARDIETQTID